MDVGLVCDQCDAFNPMASPTCTACGAPLSLGAARRSSARPDVHAAGHAAPTPSAHHASGPAAAPVEGPAAAARPLQGSARFCPECHQPMQAGLIFCGTCGARVDGSAEGRGAARAPSTPTAPSIGAPGALPVAPGPPMAAPIPGAAALPSAAPVPAKPAGGHRTPERKTMFFGAMQAARAKLVLIKGDGLDGISFTLAGQEHIAGRVEGPLLFPDDPFLSPRHANFVYRDNRLVVIDQNSTNGVFIRIRAPMPARASDCVLVGEQVLRIETTPAEPPAPLPDGTGTYFFASPRRASRLRLVQLLRGGDHGIVFHAGGDLVTLGREGNDVNFPDDPFISGHHAQISVGDAGLMVSDLGSKNGTFLRIRGEAVLQHGDYLFMGQQLLRVEIV